MLSKCCVRDHLYPYRDKNATPLCKKVTAAAIVVNLQQAVTQAGSALPHYWALWRCTRAAWSRYT
jgi:hypothetical protein